MRKLIKYIDEAYAWLCKQRRHYSPNADVWHLRFHWETQKQQIQDELTAGQFQFSPLACIKKANGETIHLWCARDALVLKMLSRYLSDSLPFSKVCTHLKGHRGLKATVKQIYKNLPHYRFVLKTDVKGYYASIDHYLLMDKLAVYIKDKNLLNLLWQYMHRYVERRGLYKEIQQGISRGCPLSPLIGTFFLTSLDEQFMNKDVYYVRYMDDILILTPTRWKLRKAVKALNQALNAHQLEKHPNKTFIGRIDRGFDFLDYRFSRSGLQVATKTIANFAARLHRLYEQKKIAPDLEAVLGDYVRRWFRWVFNALTKALYSSALLSIASAETETCQTHA